MSFLAFGRAGDATPVPAPNDPGPPSHMPALAFAQHPKMERRQRSRHDNSMRRWTVLNSNLMVHNGPRLSSQLLKFAERALLRDLFDA
jgi:hypothetical protein